jgi:pescadillo protein
MWLVPYRFVQRTGGDIDFRIMGTFVEFYTTLLGFVNFRLYTSLGLVYPPKFDAKSDERGGELGAFRLEGKSVGSNGELVSNGDEQKTITSAEAQAEVDKIAALAASGQQEEESSTAVVRTEEEEGADKIDKFEPTAPDADILPQPQASNAEIASLFAPFTFYLSRETPRAPLEFILKAFGCKRVGWDGILGDGAFTTDESDPAITHQIVDRPPLPADSLPHVPDAPEARADSASAPKVQWPRSTMPGRTYVQPQWVWDCINQGKLLRPDLYAPGAELPPHLSPWVKPKKGEYDPTLPLEQQELEGEAAAFSEEEDVEEDEEDEESDEEMEGANGTNGNAAIMDREGSVEAGEGMDVAGSEDDSEDEDDADAGAEDWDGIESDAESDISEGEAARRQHQRELEAEAAGKTLEPTVKTKKDKNAEIRKKAEKKRQQEAEEKERQKMMLPRRKRKLLKRIEHGEEKRDKESEALRKKRRRIEKAREAANAL